MMCMQAVVAAFQAVVGEQLGDGLRLGERAHEGHHDLHVRESHLVAHALERAALELEARPEHLVDVARGAAEPEHRIFLVRLVGFAADQVRILVRLEIGQAHDHHLGREGRRDLRDAFGQLVDVEAHRVGVPGDLLRDGFLELRALLIELEQGARMHADHAVDDEFEPREADA